MSGDILPNAMMAKAGETIDCNFVHRHAESCPLLIGIGRLSSSCTVSPVCCASTQTWASPHLFFLGLLRAEFVHFCVAFRSLLCFLLRTFLPVSVSFLTPSFPLRFPFFRRHQTSTLGMELHGQSARRVILLS